MSERGGRGRGDFGEHVLPVATLQTLTGPVTRLGAAAQNALEVARFGGLATDEEPSPYELASEQRVYRLRHYYADQERGGPPILLVPPLMLAAEVYDVAPNTSAVTILREHGADPWVVDFGAPEREAGGLERTLADHVLAVSDAVDRVRNATGEDVHLAGYSQGGMFCYQTAAYRRNEGLGSLITFGSPVDTRQAMPFGLPEQFATGAAELLADALRGWGLPAWASRNGFKLLDRSSRCATRSSSCFSFTTARRCCRASASGASWRGRDGSPGPDPRWRTSSGSSSPTTGCSRAGSRSRTGSSRWPTSTARSWPSSGPSTRSPRRRACGRSCRPRPAPRCTS